MLYFNTTHPKVIDFLESQIVQSEGKHVNTEAQAEKAATALKDILLSLSFILFVPFIINLIALIYLKRYIVASAVMMIFAGLMSLYMIIPAVLLITAGTMILTRHRHYIKHEKYKPYID